MFRIGTALGCSILALQLLIGVATGQVLDQQAVDEMVQTINEHIAYEESIRLQIQGLVPDAVIEANISQPERERLHPWFHPIVANHRTGQEVITAIRIDEPVAGLSVDARGVLLYDAIVYAHDFAALTAAGVTFHSRVRDFATARLTAAQLSYLAGSPAVRYVDAPDLSYPDMNVSLYETGVHLLHAGQLNSTPYTGEGAIVMVFDTGIDFLHPDFRDPADPSKTIIEYIWDVTLTPQAGESSPAHACCNYGVEYSRADIDAALAGDPNDIRSRDTNGHGTHVAGTTSSQGDLFPGIAPGATLIVVRGGVASIALTDIVNGLHYLKEKMDELDMPGVINLSLGGHAGAHDGTRADEIAMDDLSVNPGWIAVNSAGNDGSSPIHISGSIPAGGTTTVEFNVPFYIPAGANSDFFLFDLWLESNDMVNMTVTTPNDESEEIWTHNTSFSEDTPDGRVTGFNAVDVTNNHRRLNLQITDAGGTDPAQGLWQMNLSNTSLNLQEFDGWLYSRSTSMLGTSLVGGDTEKTLSMPATSNSAIVVGSYVTKWSWLSNTGTIHWYGGPNRTHNISTFSSHGPTRDGRLKPDIAAPGQGIAAARSSFAPAVTTVKGGQHYVTQGTSMSAPHAAGAIALMLGADPTLTFSDVHTLLTNHATRDAFTGPSANVTWGYGKMNVYDAMADMLGATPFITTDLLSYHYRAEILAPLSGSTRWATRFTPEKNGTFSHVILDWFSVVNSSGNLTIQIFDDASGLPGTQLGSTITLPVSDLETIYENAIDISTAGVNIASGQDYHIAFGVTGDADVRLVLDNGEFPTDRTTHYNGTSWAAFGDRFAAPVRNLHVRAVLQSPDLLLPVEIAAFRGRTDGYDVILEWVTHSERNNAGFEIQHQREGGFHAVGFVEGNGTTLESRSYAHRVSDLPPGKNVFRLRQVDFDGNASFAPTIEVFVEMPEQYRLTAAYPNPFNPQTQFTLTLALDQHVKIDVFDALGRRVAVLHDGELNGQEVHTFSFGGNDLPSGLYVYRVTGEGFSASRRMMLVK